MPEGQGVVITGLGLVLPSGAGLAAADAVFEGRSAVSLLPIIEGIPSATGAALRSFRPLAGTESADRSLQFAVSAAEEAWAAARMQRSSPSPDRIATVVSLSKGALLALADLAGQPGRQSRDWTQVWPSAAASAIAARLGATGPVLTPVTACASGGHALIWGASLIARGRADAAVVGAAEASLHPLVIGSYRRMGVLAEAGDDPAASVRPFSATRRGFAIGEGAGILVLESEASARRRGVAALARVKGWATGSQACRLAAMEPTGEALSRIMSDALLRAGIAPEAVDYIHTHGTATHDNDVAEARAIRRTLGAAAGQVSVSSTKGSHGHLLGAATAVELVLTVLAIRRGEAPPTANLTDPDPAIGLDCTPLVARRRPIRCALKIASGFGGQMAAIVLTSPTET
jgi:3-oxoacyl-(acyl-carrier-protein) synthase